MLTTNNTAPASANSPRPRTERCTDMITPTATIATPSPEAAASATPSADEFPARRYGRISQPDFDVKAEMFELRWEIWKRSMTWPDDLLPLLTNELQEFGRVIEFERHM